MPSDLYRFAAESPAAAVLKVNGKAVPVELDKGYVALTRTWKPGDAIELNLPMPVRRVLANDQVAADRGRVALERGPIVYAAEWADNPKGQVRNLMLPDGEHLAAEFKPDLLNGVTVVQGQRRRISFRCARKGHQDGAGVHGDSLLRLGESRARPDDGVVPRD